MTPPYSIYNCDDKIKNPHEDWFWNGGVRRQTIAYVQPYLLNRTGVLHTDFLSTYTSWSNDYVYSRMIPEYSSGDGSMGFMSK